MRFWVLTDERNESKVPHNPTLIPHPRDLRSQRAHYPRVLLTLRMPHSLQVQWAYSSAAGAPGAAAADGAADDVAPQGPSEERTVLRDFGRMLHADALAAASGLEEWPGGAYGSRSYSPPAVPRGCRVGQ